MPCGTSGSSCTTTNCTTHVPHRKIVPRCAMTKKNPPTQSSRGFFVSLVLLGTADSRCLEPVEECVLGRVEHVVSSLLEHLRFRGILSLLVLCGLHQLQHHLVVGLAIQAREVVLLVVSQDVLLLLVLGIRIRLTGGAGGTESVVAGQSIQTNQFRRHRAVQIRVLSGTDGILDSASHGVLVELQSLSGQSRDLFLGGVLVGAVRQGTNVTVQLGDGLTVQFVQTLLSLVLEGVLVFIVAQLVLLILNHLVQSFTTS